MATDKKNYLSDIDKLNIDMELHKNDFNKEEKWYEKADFTGDIESIKNTNNKINEKKKQEETAKTIL